MASKLITPIVLFVFLFLSHESVAAQQDSYRQADQYRRNVMWARYYWAAPGLKDKPKIKAYYQAAFDEAEKYFMQHPQEAALSNTSIRLNLISLCNSMLDYCMEPVVQASNQYTGNGLSLAAALVANEKLHGSEAQMMRKRIWKLYENAFGPQDVETKRAKKNYEDFQTIQKQIHQLP